jgi:signal transduction histidine kinase/CheY-like chemotaxis protein
VAVTRATWPFFAIAPFAPVFAAVAIATHWGSGGAGLLAIALAVGGTALAFFSTGGFAWNSISVGLFAAIALIGSRLIYGRDKATAALRASEAELRATLETVRATEEKVRRAQKMEAIGQLAAGVAHNFNNLLQVTMGYTDILLDEESDSVQSAATEIRRATQRGAVLTRQLLAFGRKHDPRVSSVDLGVTITGLGDMLTRVIREDIELTTDVAPGCAVMIDPYDLEQVVFNLVINARDALPDGGTIQVSLDLTSADTGIGRGEHAEAQGEYVRLRVRDNGIGMPPDVQAHLFEPFFTTKEVGEGTGMGLAFVDGVARHAGGFVTVDTAPQRGTTVALYLPLTDTPPVVRREPAPAPAPACPPSATILLVEDESAVRTMAALMLERAGYAVLVAGTPSRAYAIFEAEQSRISMLVTDVIMPEMHGPALADRLATLRPDLAVLFISGYTDRPPETRLGVGRTAFLPKPFTATALIAAVREALAPTVQST